MANCPRSICNQSCHCHSHCHCVSFVSLHSTNKCCARVQFRFDTFGFVLLRLRIRIRIRIRMRFHFRLWFRFDFFWVRNIFNVATEHVKQIKATRAAIADVSPTERRRQQLELPLTMGIMITSWLCWLPFRGHGAWARQTYYTCMRQEWKVSWCWWWQKVGSKITHTPHGPGATATASNF